VVGFIKDKSAIHLARVYGEKKRNFVGQHFWARGYFVSISRKCEASFALPACGDRIDEVVAAHLQCADRLVPLYQAVLPGGLQAFAERFRGLASIRSHSNPMPSGRVASDRGAQDDGFVGTEDRRVFPSELGIAGKRFGL
jgi:hypothetical protein